MSNELQIEKADGALIVRFAQPKARNPLSIGVLKELDSIADELAADTRGLIFTGSGDVFASGADLREIASVTAESAGEFAMRGQHLMAKIESLSCVTVAAVNGYCFGGALDLALACDHRFASPAAQFAHPGVGLGIITGWGGTQRLPRLIGTATALEMFFSASPIDANRALAIGLVDEVVEDVVIRAVEFVSRR